MDLDRLSAELEYAAHLGQGIPLEDLMRLKLALQTFRVDNSPDRIDLWGRVKGFHNDYYIIVATYDQKGKPFPRRDFFWA